jgi:hypothetical protein
MGRAPAKFRQADVARAIRGAIKAGLSVSRVEIDRDGKIVVICAGDAPAIEESPDDALERLRRARGWDR